MSRTAPQLKLRLPPPLRARIEQAATAAHRSLNAEILTRLEASFAQQHPHKGDTTMSTDRKDLDVCGVSHFATGVGIEVEQVVAWLADGTLPSVKIGDVRLVNLAKLCDDLLDGKQCFTEGDYHDE